MEIINNWISLLFLVILSTSQAFVHTEPEVVGWKGRSVRFPCVFSVHPIVALFWAKINVSDPDGVPDNKASFFNNEITNLDSRFTLDGSDYSLTVTDIQVANEGKYVCHVTDGSVDEKNYTTLTVNAEATKHVIKQCEDQTATDGQASVDAGALCEHQASYMFPNFNLDCTITGFRPNLSLTWKDPSGAPVTPLGDPTQRLLEDGTWERTVTISVVAKDGTDQNFTCEAKGIAVDGLSDVAITVLALSEAGTKPPVGSGGLSSGGAAAIAIFVILLICCVLIGLLTLAYRIDVLPAKVSTAIQMLPFVERRLSPEEQEEVRLLGIKEEKLKLREELRDKVISYKPGEAADIELPAHVMDMSPNINMFGQMSAGKSTFLNALNYALTGEYKMVFEEAGVGGFGGKTRERLQLQIKGTHFKLIDNRGMQSFSVDFMDSIHEQIRGERGVNPDLTIVQKNEEECHCPVFVYHDAFVSPEARREAFAFINKFQEDIHEYYGRSPIVVITHKHDLEARRELQSIKERLCMYGIPASNIWSIESYTSEKNEEDVDKDIELLEFLWQALDACDRNLGHIARKKGETVVEKPKPKKKEKEHGKMREHISGNRKDERPPPQPKKESSSSSGCAVM